MTGGRLSLALAGGRGRSSLRCAERKDRRVTLREKNARA
jgi:hypothetical protein